MSTFLDTDPIDDFNTYFRKIAKQLTQKYVLVVSDKEYRLAELEFYLNCDQHKDIFTHGSTRQLSSSQWYFHSTGKSYRGGTYKGLDITFSQLGHGGILIRAIKDNDEYIEGPCNVVNKLLQLTGCDTVAELADPLLDCSVFDEEGSIYLKPCTLEKTRLYGCPRVGLKLKNKAQEEYIFKPYRFCCFPELVSKGKHNLILELNRNGYSIDRLATKACLKRWITDYEAGLESEDKAQDYYNKNLTVAQFCKLYGILNKD
jgi:hypothetical protein